MPVLSPTQYLEGLEASLRHSPEAAKLVVEASDYFNRRWWHELATTLLKLLTDSAEARSVAADIHLNVIIPVRLDIAPELYVKIVYITVSNMSNEVEAHALLEGATNSILGVGGSKDQSYRCLQCIKALLLMANNVTLEARRLIDGVEEFANSLQTHDLSYVLRAFLAKALCRQYELLSEFTRFYDNVFDLVTYCEKAELPLVDSEIQGLAYKAALAALLSPSIHNFGRLLTFPQLVKSLDSSNDAWLLEWVRLCNAGEVSASEAFVESHRDVINTIPDVVNALPTLAKKVRLMALLHLIFYTPADKRTFRFDQIGSRCAVAPEKVGTLLLSALALHLIEGTIDGLDNTIKVSWVQPRVLSLDEVRELAKRVGEWRKSVKETAAFVEELAKEIPK